MRKLQIRWAPFSSGGRRFLLEWPFLGLIEENGFTSYDYSASTYAINKVNLEFPGLKGCQFLFITRTDGNTNIEIRREGGEALGGFPQLPIRFGRRRPSSVTLELIRGGRRMIPFISWSSYF